MSPLQSFRERGFVLLPRLISEAECADLAAALAPFEAGRPGGRNDFEGRYSKRVYSLIAKGHVFRELATHPAIVALLEEILLPHYLLSTMQSIRLLPGETVQPWHADDTFYPVSRPHAPMAVSVIWAIEAFSEHNGATEIMPGSHRWGLDHPDDHPGESIFAEMPAGSAIVFDAALWHRGGANTSLGTRLAISPQYCQPWLRPQESQLLIAPPGAAREYSPLVRSMLGYNIHPPFVGQVDGKHPLRLVDPEYRAHKTDDRTVADAVLARPIPLEPSR